MSKNAIEIPVRSTVEELLQWADRNESLKRVLEGKAFQEKVQYEYEKLKMLLQELNENFEVGENIPTFEEYSENMRVNIIGNLASMFFSDMLEGKTLQDTENETILDEEWVSGCIESLTFDLWRYFKKVFGSKHITMEIVFGSNDPEDDDCK